MGNYEDWDPEWRPVGDPVPTDDDSSDYSSNDNGVTGESGPSEPPLSGTTSADLSAPEPTLGEAWAALRQQYEAAGLGAGGVTIEPESPDEVVRGWRTRLEMPDKYGLVDLGPDESGSDQPYPDESERAQHRPAYVGPALPPDWASNIAATPYGAARPYEYEPGSNPETKPAQPEDDWQARARQTQRAFDLIQAAEQADHENRARQTKRALEILQALGNEQQPILNEWGIPNPDQPLVPRVSGLPEKGALQQGHEWLQQNVPGFKGAEDVLGGVLKYSQTIPPAVGGGIEEQRRYLAPAFQSLSPQDQATLSAAQERGEYAEPPTWAELETIEAARQRYADKIAALRAADTRTWQERIDDAHRAYEENVPLPLQIGLAYGDPGNVLLGFPFKAGAAVLNTRRVGALEKAIAGLDKADDSYRVVKTAIQSAKAEGLGSKEASRILQNVENLVLKGTRPPGIPPIAKIVAPKGTEGQDLFLEVLNKNKAPGMAPFQSLDDVAKRADEATRIVDEYRASTPGFVQFWDKPGTKPIDLKILMKQPLTDVDTPEVLDARLLDALTPSTWPIHTPARIQMRLDAGKGLHDYGGSHYGVVPKQERQAFIITGNSGSGKSTIAIPLAQRAGARIIDPDDALLFYSQYNGINASALHQEAVWTYEHALKRAVQNGENVVIPRLGGDPDVIRKLRDKLAKAGYEVNLLTMDVPVETAKKSAVARFSGSEHRFVDPLIPQRVGLTPVETYEILKKEGGFATYGLYTRGGAGRLPGIHGLLEESAPGLGAVAGRRPSSWILARPMGAGIGPGKKAAAASAIAAAARAEHAQTSGDATSSQTKYGTKREPDHHALDTPGALRADKPPLVLQYLRQQLSKLGYSGATIDQLRMGDAAQIIAEGRTPKAGGGESPSGQGSARGSAPGGVGSGGRGADDRADRPSGQRPSRPRPPLSLSQQMAQLYRGTVAGDGYRGDRRATDQDAWAMVPDDLKGALEEYWHGEPLTREKVQRLTPVYRRYVAQTGYPGDMVKWITDTLQQQRYPQRRAGGRAHATSRLAA